MIFATPLPFIKGFIDQLDQGIRDYAPTRKLSKAQRWWLSFCLRGILLSNQVCWAEFERVGLGGYTQAAFIVDVQGQQTVLAVAAACQHHAGVEVLWHYGRRLGG